MPTVNVYAFRNDKTKSGVWQRQSVCALEAEAYIMRSVLPIPSDADFGSVSDVFAYISRLSDIQVCPGSSGSFPYALTVKQLRALRVPVWDEGDTNPAYASSTHWYLNTSDQGSDQVRARRVIAGVTADSSHVIFMTHDCWEHVCHLIIGQSLRLSDAFLKEWRRGWKYYSTLAIISNVWRDNARAIFDWCSASGPGPESAHDCARTLIPKACAARWGAVESVEARLDHVADYLHAALLGVFVGDDVPIADDAAAIAATALEQEAVLAAGPDARKSVGELASDSIQAWTVMMGRWRRQALVATSDKLFWGLVTSSLWCRAPTRHIQAFFHCPLRDHLAELASGKA